MDEARGILAEFGLTPAQAALYLALLRQQQVLAQLSRKTGLHRRSIITTLHILSEKGLVQKKSDGTYSAQPLMHLKKLLEQKQAVLLEHLPLLTAQYEATKDTQIVNLLRGVEGVKAILADEILKQMPIFVLFGQCPEMYKPPIEAFDSIRVKQHIPLSIICASSATTKRPLCETRFVKEFKTPMEIHIYANKVGIFLWEKEPVVISIKKEEITQSWKRYFDWLWSVAK